MSPKLIRSADASPLMWTEKYRPKSLDEIRGNEPRIEALKELSKNPSSMPHLLLSGSPGTGKTTAALCFAKTIGATVEEMNASDERGIAIVQGKVKEYASSVPLDGNQYKILIMDEADHLTKDAQPALRRMMETTARSCRFIMIANEIDGIIKPIRDRCSQLYFDPIPDEDIMFTLGAILEAEHHEMDEEAGQIITRRAMGSLRQAINSLQIVCDGTQGPISTDRVKQIMQASEIDGVSDIISKCISGDFTSAKIDYVTHFKGYAGAQDFIEMVTRDLIQGKLRDHEKLIAKNLSFLQMGAGRNDYLQVLGFLARLSE